MEDVLIANLEKLEEIKKAMAEGGAEKLHVLADFDRTLTKAFVEGKSVPSLISILRDGNYLSPTYAHEANELYEKYHPIEINSKVSFEEKKKAMEQWWMAHFELLIELGLNKSDIEKIIDSEKVKLREGTGQFLEFLKAHNIPLVIMSSSGLGTDSIHLFLKKEGKFSDNIYIISNSFQWDKNGKAIRVNQPIIHGMNKDDTQVRDFPFFDKIKNRKNVLLLGDNLADIDMIKGFDCDNLLKVGFLNENVEKNLEHYKNNFDAVILNDSPLDFINQLLREIIKK